MIVGIGVDLVDLARFQMMLDRTPHLVDRLFTAAERNATSQSLAARFAAKEAVAKALGAPAGLEWQDTEVRKDDTGRPYLSLTGTVAAAAAERGVARWHLSMSHDAGMALAMVVAESDA
jgi:holo-[acyl-carrier protein] synthase